MSVETRRSPIITLGDDSGAQRGTASSSDAAHLRFLPKDSVPLHVRAAVDRVARACSAGRNSDVIRDTRDAEGVDEAGTLLLLYRAVAFAQAGLFRSAMSTFARTLRSPACHGGLRHFVLLKRAEVYADDGRRAQARRDLRLILAEDPTAAVARERLDQLGAR